MSTNTGVKNKDYVREDYVVKITSGKDSGEDFFRSFLVETLAKTSSKNWRRHYLGFGEDILPPSIVKTTSSEKTSLVKNSPSEKTSPEKTSLLQRLPPRRLLW